jgi:hypothetical protein
MKKIITIAIILVLLGGILLFLSSKKAPKPTTFVNTVNKEIEPEEKSEEKAEEKPKELTEEEKIAILKNELRLKARNFAERYGSFSTDARFANLFELKNEMSKRLWQEIENYIKEKEKEEVKEFYGITTKVLNVEEKDFSENEANYLILTQRIETKGTEQKVFYQNLSLKMIKENGEWKVDSVKWE